MAVIYLTHPVHGAKVAIAEAEAIFDESCGWMRYDIETLSAAVEDEPVNEMAEHKRRGRPRSKQED